MSGISGPVRPGMDKTPLGRTGIENIEPELAGALEGNEGEPSAENPFVTVEGLTSAEALGQLSLMVASRQGHTVRDSFGHPVLRRPVNA